MKLCKVILKNFRGYENQSFDIKDLNVVIGKNDVGKSTMLQALNIFFNNNKASLNDLNKKTGLNNIIITCCFEVNQDEEIVFDSTAKSTLKKEYLLNSDGLLVIQKTYSGSTLKESSIVIKAEYPYIEGENPLITQKQTQLKKLAIKKEIALSEIEDRRANKDYRSAIFNKVGISLKEQDIEVLKQDQELVSVYENLKELKFPRFCLFESDRTNTDKDDEVSDVLNAITKKAIDSQKDAFIKIKQEIEKKVAEVSSRTLDKLKTFDDEIASKLEHELISKPIDKMFSFTFNSDDGVPFNNRGSGIKRLMLLSFFMADIEENDELEKNVIYAIEEPETSQHPNYQKIIIENLLDLSIKKNRQVILTTHTPEIVKMVNTDNLIFIKKLDGTPAVYQGEFFEENITPKEISESLGLLPYIPNKAILLVEGVTDELFIKNISNKFPDLNRIININNIDIVPLSGCKTVKKWIKKGYLNETSIIQIAFMDRDEMNFDELKKIDDDCIIRTKRREIENYIPLAEINKLYGIDLKSENIDINNDDISAKIKEKNNKKEGNIKKDLQDASFWENMDHSLLYEKEFKDWFNKIKEVYDSSFRSKM